MNLDIKKLLMLINELGYEAYLVGGAVRDYVIGIPNHDYDIASNIPSEKLKEILPRIKFMKDNDRRHTGTITTNNMVVEISSFKGPNIIEDLSKRDFTINAMAMDANGNIIDPFNGIQDIKEKRVKLIKQNGEAFEIDPLRILRAIRQADKLGFSIDENCKQNMSNNSTLLSNVAGERIYNELSTIIASPNIGHILTDYKNIVFSIFPELEVLDGFNQHNQFHIYDIYNHTIKVVENTEPDLVLRLAALFHDVGKPNVFTLDEMERGHFYNHAEASNAIFLNIAKRLKMDKRTKSRVSRLIRMHEMDLSLKANKMYKFLEKFGLQDMDLLFKLKAADIKGHNPEYLFDLETLEETKNKYFQLINRINFFNSVVIPVLTKKYEGHNIRPILHDLRREFATGRTTEEQELVEYIGKKA